MLVRVARWTSVVVVALGSGTKPGVTPADQNESKVTRANRIGERKTGNKDPNTQIHCSRTC